MSHISKQVVQGFENVHPDILQKALELAVELLKMNGFTVTDFVYDWEWSRIREWEGMKIIAGIGTSRDNNFRGVGLAIDENGKLALVGDSFAVQDEWDDIRKLIMQVIGGCCHLVARSLIAQAKGQRVTIVPNVQTRQLQMVVDM